MQIKQTSTIAWPNQEASLRVELFSFCEAAFEQEGRLTMLKSFEALHAPALPVVVPKATVVVRLRLLPAEVEKRGFHLRLIDPDGLALLASLEGVITPVPIDEDRACAYNLIFQLSGATFATYGEHRLEFHLDGQLEAHLPLQLHRC